jgi:ribonuclease BN (tRNA processing enzyme)
VSLSVTIMGCSGTHIGPDRMCSSYLVESARYRLLLDCGNGSLSNLQRRLDVADVDAVLLSHLHPDHFGDLYSLYYALRFHADGRRSVPVYAPAGADEFVGRILGDSSGAFGEVLRFSAVAAGQVLELGPLTVELFAANHPVEALASRVSAGGRVLAYTGDSDATPELEACARGADLLLCDATWLEADGPHPAGVHLTGAGAGRTADAAGARRLVVTHLFPGTEPRAVAAEAAGAYDGDVLIATDLQELHL